MNRFAVCEVGPSGKLRGWSDFVVVDREARSVRSAVGKSGSGHSLAERMGAEYYARGQWENPDAPTLPRPEIIAGKGGAL